ncbi:LAFA_0E00936g1_1 [Lachancea sp. 'fantastica']|nr:LAFA_0E00936g1_1 [Lachancea sp. 'fantastica']
MSDQTEEKTSNGTEAQEQLKDEGSFQSRVARLSLCEDGKSREMIMKSIQNTDQSSSETPVDDVKDDNESSKLSQIRPKAGSKRRRRSSGITRPSLAHIKDSNCEVLSSSSSVLVTKKKKKASQPPQLTIGQKAYDKTVSIKDLRDLVLYLFDDTNNAPRWLTVENHSSVSKVVVLFVPGLLPEDLENSTELTIDGDKTNKPQSASDSLSEPQFVSEMQRAPVTTPGSANTIYSAYNAFVNVKLSKNEKELKKQELSKKKITLNDLVLRLDQLLENEYPIHQDAAGLSGEEKELLSAEQRALQPVWKDTQPFEHDGCRTFSMDCEMCMTENGLVLTRVSLVDFDCRLIYDSLVKPDATITDYLTKYSGITEEKLRDVTTTLEDVQCDLLKLVSSTDILIGHSLQSDLNVLKLRHPKIIDTAIIYEHKAGPPFRPALKYLASDFLNQDIQNSDGLGHDSFEDARACMELTKLKIVNGLSFGVGINTENLFHRLAKRGIRSMCLNDYAPKSTGLTGVGHSAEASVRCQDDSLIFENINEHLHDFNLFVGRLRDLEFSRKYAVAPKSDFRNLDVSAARSNFFSKLQDLYCKSPPSTVFIVCSGNGDTRDYSKIMSELNAMNRDDRNEQRKLREKEVQEAVVKARSSMLLLAVRK